MSPQYKHPQPFVTALIHDVADNLTLIPVVDDRMFVQCWYKNDQLTAGYFGMNNTALTGTSDAWYNHIWPQIFLILGITGVVFIIAVLLLKNRGAR